MKEIDAMNERFYNAKASSFETISKRTLDFVCERLEEEKGPILDVGAGTGLLAEWFQANRGVNILCLDPSKEMVLRCRARRLKAIQVTLQQFQTDQIFSAVFALASLFHIPKAELPQQLEKIACFLSPGGMFFFSLIAGEGEGFYGARFFALYQRDEVFSLLKKTGFAHVDCVEWPWFYYRIEMKMPFGNYLLFFAKTLGR